MVPTCPQFGPGCVHGNYLTPGHIPHPLLNSITTFRLFQSNNIQNGLFFWGAQIGGSVQPTWELGCAAAIPNEVEGSRLGPASRPMTRSHRHPLRSVPARSAPGPTDSDPVGHRAEVAAVPAKAKRLTRRVRPTFPISFVFRNFPSGFQRFFAISRHGRASGVWAVGLRFISVKLCTTIWPLRLFCARFST